MNCTYSTPAVRFFAILPEEVELVDGGDIAVRPAVARIEIGPCAGVEGNAARADEHKPVQHLHRRARRRDHEAAGRDIVILDGDLAETVKFPALVLGRGGARGRGERNDTQQIFRSHSVAPP
jgi:hypothetical protein